MANIRLYVVLSVCTILSIRLGYANGQDDTENSVDSPGRFFICEVCECTRSVSSFEGQSETLDISCNRVKNKMDLELVMWPVDELSNINVYFDHLSMSAIQKIPKNDRVMSLSFDNNEIRTIWSQAFAKVSNLKYLSLSNNKLDRITADMFNEMDYLEEVDLSNNNLTQFNEEGFQELKSLAVLKLDGNNLDQIPAQFLTKLSKLEYLYMSRNKISYLDFKELNNCVEILNNLKVIDFSGNNLNLVTKEQFKNMISLKMLNLSHNNIKIVESKAFIHCPFLKTIDLSYNSISALNGIPLSITSLHLEMNKFLNIPSFSSNLTYLDISRNEINEVTNENYESIRNIVVLNLSSNYLGNEFIIEKPIVNLTVLDLSYNKITEVPEYISDSMFPRLRELYIDGNPLNELSIKSEISLNKFSAKYMPKIVKIGKPFNIKARKSDDRSCVEIFISHNDKLSIVEENTFENLDICYLDLSHNQLKDLPESAAKWSNIHGVNLQGNPWDCECKLQWVLDSLLEKLYIKYPSLLHELRCATPRQYQELRFVHWYKWNNRAFCDVSANFHRFENVQLAPSMSSSTDDGFENFNLKDNVLIIVLILCITAGLALIIGLIVYLARGRYRHNAKVMGQVKKRRQTPDDAKLDIPDYDDLNMLQSQNK